ncbi:PTS system protein [Klebsiella pneumoniae]|nr:PTS system protein [Klebsiella pneumoniae]
MTAKTAPKITLWEFFQQLGKTFMLPVALLSFCGIMLGIGSSLSSHDVLTLLPWLDMPLLQAIFIWMSKVGSFAFSFLPVMFCIAIPLGLARENKGVAAFAGFVGYAVMNLAVNFWLTAKGILPTTDAAILKANNIQNIIGIPSIDTGILGAVIAGIIVWLLHERFHNIRLPDALAFFGGTRFVPIVTTVVLGLVGLAIPLVWPVFAMGINALGKMINSAGDFGPMIFGTGERLLLPFGLHHILVALIRFTEAGGTLDVCGHSVSGALTIFQAQLSCPTTHGFAESATRFLSQGKMPAFLGGLPGAALAMYHCARPENRHKIKGLLISGVIACVVGGTTEPLEFLVLVCRAGPVCHPRAADRSRLYHHGGARGNHRQHRRQYHRLRGVWHSAWPGDQVVSGAGSGGYLVRGLLCHLPLRHHPLQSENAGPRRRHCRQRGESRRRYHRQIRV